MADCDGTAVDVVDCSGRSSRDVSIVQSKMSSSSICLILPPLLFTVKIKALQSIADQSALQASVSDRRVMELEIALSASTLEAQDGTKLIGILKVGTPITTPHIS